MSLCPFVALTYCTQLHTTPSPPNAYLLAASTVKVDMREAVEFLPEEDLPLSMRLKTEPAASFKFESRDEDLDLGDLTVNGLSAVGTANVLVDDSTP